MYVVHTLQVAQHFATNTHTRARAHTRYQVKACCQEVFVLWSLVPVGIFKVPQNEIRVDIRIMFCRVFIEA